MVPIRVLGLLGTGVICRVSPSLSRYYIRVTYQPRQIKMTNILHAEQVTGNASTVTDEDGVIVFSHHNFINSENFIGQFGYELQIRKGSAIAEFLKTNEMPRHFTVRTARDHHTSNQFFTKYNIKWRSGNLEAIYSQTAGNCRTFLRMNNLTKPR